MRNGNKSKQVIGYLKIRVLGIGEAQDANIDKIGRVRFILDEEAFKTVYCGACSCHNPGHGLNV